MSGRTVAVTGCVNGIGAATKQLLESQGDRVIGVDLHTADVTADLSTVDGRRAAIEEVHDACDGRLDGLIPCAGVGRTVAPDVTVRLNYYGMVALLDGLRPALAAGTDAPVVVISSNSTTMTPGLSVDDAAVYLDQDEDAAVAHFQDAGWMAYPAGKLALAFWVRSNAAAWMADGIRLNAVAPGVTRTAMIDAVEQDLAAKAGLAQIPIPAGRWADPSEVAAPIAFVASPAASYIVGRAAPSKSPTSDRLWSSFRPVEVGYAQSCGQPSTTQAATRRSQPRLRPKDPILREHHPARRPSRRRHLSR